MKPAPFAYFAPTTLGEVVSLLGQHRDEAKVLAGGQSLMPLLNMRMARPSVVVDLRKVPDLDAIREEAGALVTGAMVRKRDVEHSELVQQRHPLLHAATCWIAHPQIRNQGTVGGSLAQADPASEYPALVVALDAELLAAGPGGERTIAGADFYVTYLTTALADDEVLVGARWPLLPEGAGWSVQEFSRRHGDYAIVGTVATLSLGGDGRIAGARIVPFGVGPVPVRMTDAEALLAGEAPGEALFARAGAAAADALEDPLSDVHASADYRRHLCRVLVARALAEAAGRAAPR